MIRGLLIAFMIFAGLMTSVPCQAQVEPALPTWNWDNPLNDPTPWAPSTVTYIEIGALALGLDFYFGGRVSGAAYRAITGGGRYLWNLARPSAPTAPILAIR